MQVLFSILLIACPLQRPLSGNAKILALQMTLNEAQPYGEPIVLAPGDDFESAHGTVLLLTRDEGAKQLIAIARDGKDEVSAIFLPCWDAWIVDWVWRSRDKVRSDTRYGVAALMSHRDVEYWHTHNSITDGPVGTAQQQRETIMSAMVPSDLDTMELFAAREKVGKPLPGLRGVVAGVLGTVTYWSDDLGDRSSTPIPGLLDQVLRAECSLLITKAKRTTPRSFGEMTRRHRGIFWYRFRPFP